MDDPFVTITLGGPSLPPVQAEKLPPAKQPAPADQGQRAVFVAMRELAQEYHSPRFDYHAAFYSQDQRALISRVFYKQALFMQDFTDDFDRAVPFSSYYPAYQSMSYEQLRTYFTWRAAARAGRVTHVSVSYAFLYTYELINQIGVADPQEGLQQLLSFWRAYRPLNLTLDKHIFRWFKDYHIYYGLPDFGGFVRANGMEHHYTEPLTYTPDSPGRLALYCAMGNYNIRDSAFFTDETGPLVRDAVCAVMDGLYAACPQADNWLFPPVSQKHTWQPFMHALFVPAPDTAKTRTPVILSEKEIYVCRKGVWTCRTAKEGNRGLMGYILKQTEAGLRKALRYKHTLSAGLRGVDDNTLRGLQAADIQLDVFIEKTVAAFIAEKNRVVVRVNAQALMQIRREALETQEKLTISEELGLPTPVPVAPLPPPVAEDTWEGWARSLTHAERDAVCAALDGGDFKACADRAGLMAEVLSDGINQKAVDRVGDTILEYDGEKAVLYAEYEAEIRRVLGHGK